MIAPKQRRVIAKWAVFSTVSISLFWSNWYFVTDQVPFTWAIKSWPRQYDVVLGLILPAIVTLVISSKRCDQPECRRLIWTGFRAGAIASLGFVALLTINGDWTQSLALGTIPIYMLATIIAVKKKTLELASLFPAIWSWSLGFILSLGSILCLILGLPFGIVAMSVMVLLSFLYANWEFMTKDE